MGIHIYQRTGRHTGVSTGPLMAFLILFFRVSVWMIMVALAITLAVAAALVWAAGYLAAAVMAIPGDRSSYRRRFGEHAATWTAQAARLAARFQR